MIMHRRSSIVIYSYLRYTVCPNKKETRFISGVSSSLSRKISLNYMLHYQGHFLFFHLIPNTRLYLNMTEKEQFKLMNVENRFAQNGVELI